MQRLFIIFLSVLFTAVVSYASQIHTNLSELGAVKIHFPGDQRFELGATVSSAGDFNNDGFFDIAVCAPSFDLSSYGFPAQTGAVFVVYGSKLDKNISEIDLSSESVEKTVIIGTPEAPVGNAVAATGDVNDDGFNDLALGTVNHRSGYVLFGSKEPAPVIKIGEAADQFIEMINTGYAVSSAGDFNGDFVPDVIFGNPASEEIPGGESTYTFGAFSVLFGGIGIVSPLDTNVPSDFHVKIRGAANTRFAESVSGGINLNADGFSEIIIAEPNGGKDHEGRAYVIYGGSHINDDQAEYALVIDGVNQEVQACHDIHGDGFPDLLVGLDNNSVLILNGGSHLKGTLDLKNVNPDWGTIIHGAQAAYSAGDLNGDGINDIALAIPNAAVGDQLLTGRVMFLFGQAQLPGELDIQKMLTGQYAPVKFVMVDGLNAFDTFGASVAAIGDIQGDGFDDVVIGAPTVRLPGGTAQDRPGAVYIIQGVDIYMALQTHRSAFTLQDSRR